MKEIRGPEDIAAMVRKWGFLPFFANGIPGFSIAEHTPPELWFTDRPGPWEWKGPVASGGECVYGKFFHGKAGYVSLDILPDFANYRRDGYDFEGRWDEGLAPRQDKEVYDTLAGSPSLLSKELKRLCGYRRGGNGGFDTRIARLQMQTYVVISDFEYERDKYGREYGWGVARYAALDALVGEDFFREAYERAPEESFRRCVERLTKGYPGATPEQAEKLLRG